MTELPRIARLPSVCPHDCPSACSLEVEVIDGKTIGRVRGNKRQSYTDGVICAKVARYAERIHHPDRLLHPLRRTGPKGSGRFEQISWDEALDTIADTFRAKIAEHGSETVMPVTPKVSRASRTSSHLCGLITAVTSFIRLAPS